jgi:acyl-CoA thioesterase
VTFDGEALRARVEASAYHRANEAVLEAIEPGRVVMRIRIQPFHLNPQDIVHGGVIAGLLDSVCGISLRTLLPDDVTHRTVQLSVTYLRAATEGTLVGTGRTVHSGRRVGNAEAEVHDEAGRLVARGTAVFVKLPVA